MLTLTVWKFKTPDGADQFESTLVELQKQELITINDAAKVVWREGAKKPKTIQMHNLKAAGAMSGAFWGMLFGLLFLIPIFGLAIGAAAGALGGSMADIGIDDKFIDDVRASVTPGTSALFVMTTGAVVDRVLDALKEQDAELVHTNMSGEQEAKLREAFAEED